MKALLINPPRENEIIANNPAIIESQRGANPPLGLLYVAGYLQAHTRHHVVIIDAIAEKLSYQELGRRIAREAPDVAGITAMTLTLLDVLQTAALVKDQAPKARVVLGGPHVNLYPDQTIRLPHVDYLVLGEGERTFARLLDALEGNIRPGQTPGLVFCDKGQIINTGVPEPIHDLDSLPHPARNLVPAKAYSSILGSGGLLTTLFTSRGCPFSCTFCNRPQMGRRFRARSAFSVTQEMALCRAMGIREFLIYDDTFTVDPERVNEICEQIILQKLDVRFDIRARVDTVDAGMLARLKAAGCAGIHFGVESGSDRVLERLGKNIRRDQVKKAFDLTRQADIATLAYFMIGNPSETIADMEDTFTLAREIHPDFAHITILTPFPGTALYAEALEKGIIATDVWAGFAKEPRPGFTPPHWGEFFTRQELMRMLRAGYRRFYLHPSYILDRLKKTRSFSDLAKKARAGWSVARMK